MDWKILKMKVRIHTLAERDPVANANIIKKLQRQLRHMEGKLMP